MFLSISRLFIRWRGAKVYSQTGWRYGRISPTGSATVRHLYASVVCIYACVYECMHLCRPMNVCVYYYIHISEYFYVTIFLYLRNANSNALQWLRVLDQFHFQRASEIPFYGPYSPRFKSVKKHNLYTAMQVDNLMHLVVQGAHAHGRRTRENLGYGPPKEDGPCVRPPPIFWEVVFVGCGLKHEQSKKGVIKELFSEIGVFVKKGPYIYIYLYIWHHTQ